MKETYGMSSGTAGALSELAICVDLLKYGFEVFRSISPTCSCDLIASRNRKSWRIEVRTGYISAHDFIGCPLKDSDIGRFDILAINVIGHGVVYVPDFITGGDPLAPMARLNPAARKRIARVIG